MILVIDHNDSFVENLARMMREVDKKIETHTLNQDAPIGDALALNPRALVLSPGPGTPQNTGISLELLAHFKGKIPILGVCLGHQAIACAYRGDVVRTNTPRHGKAASISHNGHTLFDGLAPSFQAGLYHSLYVKTLPPDFISIAHNHNQDIMAMAHKELPIFGMQFHPESILTPDGHILLRNFLRFVK